MSYNSIFTSTNGIKPMSVSAWNNTIANNGGGSGGGVINTVNATLPVVANTVGTVATLSMVSSPTFSGTSTMPSANIGTAGSGGLTLNGKTFQDPSTATNGQVLQINSGGNMVFVTDTGTGTVTSVNGASNQLTITSGSSSVNPTLGFANPAIFPGDIITTGASTITTSSVLSKVISIADSTTGDPDFIFPVLTSIPPVNNIIVSNGMGTSSFSNLSGLVTNTDNNVVFAVDGSNREVINLGNTLKINNNIITNVGTQGNNSSVVSIGPNALNGITNAFTDSLLVGIGKSALQSLTSVAGLNQCVVGNFSGNNLSSSSNYNLVYGNQSLADLTNTNCTNNISLGHYSSQNVAGGEKNIVIGNSSMSTTGGSANTDVNENIVIGHGSLLNVVGGGANNIILGNGVNLAVANDNGNFLVDPANITKMAIGNIISGDATRLAIPNMKNPFSTNPSMSGQVLASDTSGNLSWTVNAGSISTLTTNLTFNGQGTSVTDFLPFTDCIFNNINGIKSLRIPFSELYPSYNPTGLTNSLYWSAVCPSGWNSSAAGVTGSGCSFPIYQVSNAFIPNIIAVYQGIVSVTIGTSAANILISMIDPSQSGNTNVSIPFVTGNYYIFNGFLRSGVNTPIPQDLIVQYY